MHCVTTGQEILGKVDVLQIVVFRVSLRNTDRRRIHNLVIHATVDLKLPDRRATVAACGDDRGMDRYIVLVRDTVERLEIDIDPGSFEDCWWRSRHQWLYVDSGDITVLADLEPAIILHGMNFTIFVGDVLPDRIAKDDIEDRHR